jgi:hypothetical protein
VEMKRIVLKIDGMCQTAHGVHSVSVSFAGVGRHILCLEASKLIRVVDC